METAVRTLVDETPDEYLELEEEQLVERIRARKREYGKRMVMLGHNYQRYGVYSLADYHGDSYGLAKVATEQKEAEFIVFCGVRFMVETTRVLAQPHQAVVHPTHLAGCPMADMASIHQVEKGWNELSEILDIRRVIPMTYMNSDATLKAFCGEHGGIVCTSSNAGAAFEWAFARGDKILFFPDEHLGRNTANRRGIPKHEQLLWDYRKPLGGAAPEHVEKARVLLWRGFCHVHQWFTPEHVFEIREKYPDARVVVHPECTEETVAAADAEGSTGFIEKYVRDAKPGDVIAVGTEIQMVSRLALQHPDRTVLPLSRSLCPNMYKVNLSNLAYSVDRLGEVNVVTLPQDIIDKARIALERMLEVS